MPVFIYLRERFWNTIMFIQEKSKKELFKIIENPLNLKGKKNILKEKLSLTAEKDHLNINQIPAEVFKANTLSSLKPVSVLDKIRKHFNNVYMRIAGLVDFEQVRRFKSDYYYTKVNKYLREGEEALRALFERNFDEEIEREMSSRLNKHEPYFPLEHLKTFLKDGETLETVSLKELDSRAMKSCKERKINKNVDEIKKIVESVDKVFEHSKIPETVTVYRGVPKKIADKIIHSDRIFEDEGFVSTSYLKEKAELFGGSHILEIEVPAGSKAIDMKTALPHARWEDWEEELLLPRNSRFEIVKIDEENKVIKLKLLKDQ